MTIIERITQLIAKEYGPTYAMVVYMCLAEFEPDEVSYEEYGSIACNRLKQMQAYESEGKPND